MGERCCASRTILQRGCVTSPRAITERRACTIVSDLADAGYVLKERDGQRNRYIVQDHLPLPETTVRERTVGEFLDLLVGGILPIEVPSSAPASSNARSGGSPTSVSPSNGSSPTTVS